MSTIIRGLIDDERSALPRSQRDSAPAIVHRLLQKTRWLYNHHFDALQLVTGAGFNQMVRAALKKPDGPITEPQLDLWPDEVREHLRAGGHAALYVPSRGRFVPLVPGMISKAELGEAADYLITHGYDVVRRGQAYKRAASLMA
jgi:hypothetical protein